VLEMRLLAEMSYREIAAALGIPIGTVMSRLNRGRRQIQAALAGQPAATGATIVETASGPAQQEAP
jgi:RNA polymerase sigma-70 factor (ECF subfamily)